MSGLNTNQISLAMRNRWRLTDGYAMIEEVGNGTGARCTRRADAIVMSCAGLTRILGER